jgi:PAS domain S-box-containing protein
MSGEPRQTMTDHQLETLLHRAPLGVYLVDADFRIQTVNPVAQPVFGGVPGGVIGRDLDEIIHLLWEKEYADEVVRIFRRTLETGEPYYTPARAEHRADRGVTEYYEWQLDRLTLPDGR